MMIATMAVISCPVNIQGTANMIVANLHHAQAAFCMLWAAPTSTASSIALGIHILPSASHPRSPKMVTPATAGILNLFTNPPFAPAGAKLFMDFSTILCHKSILN